MVSHWPFTAEALVQPQACRCVNCGGRSGTEAKCFRSTLFLPCQHHCTNVLYTCASNTAASSRTEGQDLWKDTKQRSFCSRRSIGEVDVQFFMLDGSDCTGFSSSNSVFVKPVAYHRGSLLFRLCVSLVRRTSGRIRGTCKLFWIDTLKHWNQEFFYLFWGVKGGSFNLQQMCLCPYSILNLMPHMQPFEIPPKYIDCLSSLLWSALKLAQFPHITFFTSQFLTMSFQFHCNKFSVTQ